MSKYEFFVNKKKEVIELMTRVLQITSLWWPAPIPYRHLFHYGTGRNRTYLIHFIKFWISISIWLLIKSINIRAPLFLQMNQSKYILSNALLYLLWHKNIFNEEYDYFWENIEKVRCINIQTIAHHMFPFDFNILVRYQILYYNLLSFGINIIIVLLKY